MTFTDLVQSINSSIYIMPLSAAQAGFFVFFPKKQEEKKEEYQSTWQASTPPLRTPAQNIRDVIWPAIKSSHTAWFMILTEAFWSTTAADPETNTHKEEVTSLGIFKKLKMLVLQVVFI